MFPCAEVGDDELCRAACGPDVGDDGIAAGLVAAADDDEGALRGQCRGDGDPETARGAGDQCCAAIQPLDEWTHGSTGTLSKMDLQVQKLTAKGQATRQRIIEGAAAEIRERGVAVATLDDIRARTQTSKSQLFHYFPDGKEQLLLAVAEHEAQMVLDDQQPYLGALTSWAAWQRWRDAVVDRYRRQGQHCPLAVLMSEIGRSTPGAQAVTRR